VGVVAEEHGGMWRSWRSRVGKEVRQGKVGIRAPIGEVQAQFLHRRRERFAVGVTEERKKAEFGEGGKGDRRHMRGEEHQDSNRQCRWWPCMNEWRQWNGGGH
jgi:hypothetical protein